MIWTTIGYDGCRTDWNCIYGSGFRRTDVGKAIILVTVILIIYVIVLVTWIASEDGFIQKKPRTRVKNIAIICWVLNKALRRRICRWIVWLRWRETILRLYADILKLWIRSSIYFARWQLLCLSTSNIGFMKISADPIIIFTQSCSDLYILPITATVVVAVAPHSCTVLCVVPWVWLRWRQWFLSCFILYFRFTPDKAVFCNDADCVHTEDTDADTIVYGLLEPLCAVRLHLERLRVIWTYVKRIMNNDKGSRIEVLPNSAFAQQLFNNKEMWTAIIAFVICLL